MKKLSICMLLLIFAAGAWNEKEVDGKEDVPATSQEVQPDTCPICLSDIEASEAILTCKELCKDGDARHVFHEDCLTKYLKEGVGVYGCPVCRKPLKDDDDLRKKYERVVSCPVDPGLDLLMLLSILASERDERADGPGRMIFGRDELVRDETYPDFTSRFIYDVLAESRRAAEARDLAERRRAAERRFARGFLGLGGHSEREAEERDLESGLGEVSPSTFRDDLSEHRSAEQVDSDHAVLHIAAAFHALAERRRAAERFARGLSSNRIFEEPSIRPLGREGHEEVSAHDESLGSVLVHAFAERERALARLRELGELIELRHRLEELRGILDRDPGAHRDRDHEDDHDLPRCPIS